MIIFTPLFLPMIFHGTGYKFEVFERFKEFRHEVENKFEKFLRFFDWVEEMNTLIAILESSNTNSIVLHWTPLGTNWVRV